MQLVLDSEEMILPVLMAVADFNAVVPVHACCGPDLLPSLPLFPLSQATFTLPPCLVRWLATEDSRRPAVDELIGRLCGGFLGDWGESSSTWASVEEEEVVW